MIVVYQALRVILRISFPYISQEFYMFQLFLHSNKLRSEGASNAVDYTSRSRPEPAHDIALADEKHGVHILELEGLP
jgi:hypothetical protein